MSSQVGALAVRSAGNGVGVCGSAAPAVLQGNDKLNLRSRAVQPASATKRRVEYRPKGHPFIPASSLPAARPRAGPKRARWSLLSQRPLRTHHALLGCVGEMQRQITDFMPNPRARERALGPDEAVSEPMADTHSGPYRPTLNDLRRAQIELISNPAASMRQIYGLEGERCQMDPAKGKKCAAIKCGSNPLCLNHLGSARWMAATAFDEYVRKRGDIEFEEVPEGPVGMINLGATCYIATALQVWFHDRAIREGVLQFLAEGGVGFTVLFLSEGV